MQKILGLQREMRILMGGKIGVVHIVKGADCVRVRGFVTS